MNSNNSAQFCLGFITKVDRGVVRGLGEIKILQGGIPSPQTQLRAHAFNSQAKMRGVNSALLRSHCKGGGGSEHACAYTSNTAGISTNTHTHTYKHTHTHTSPPVLMQVLPSSSHCFVLLALVICVFKFSYIFSHLRPCCILIFYRLFVFRGLMLLLTLVSSVGASMQHTANEALVCFLCCRRLLFVTYCAISSAHEIIDLSIGKNGS